MSETPTVGDDVLYTIGAGDVAVIDQLHPQVWTGPGSRNPVQEGDVYPAKVVRVFDPSTTTANLVVQLDGAVQYWATSRTEGDGPGHWSWPGRA